MLINNITTKILILITVLNFVSFKSIAQKELTVGGINFRYEIKKDSIFCFLSAPTQGWVMLGFNNKNSTQGADFKFFAVAENEKVVYSDRKNIKARNYPSDITLGGQNNISVHYSNETEDSTSILFSLPITTADSNDFQHSLKKQFWLILAYSIDDDFNHHSRVRKHLPFSWEP